MSAQQLIKTIEAGVANESLITAVLSAVGTGMVSGMFNSQAILSDAVTSGAATALGCNVAMSMIAANPSYIGEEDSMPVSFVKKGVVAGLVTVALFRLGGRVYPGGLMQMGTAALVAGSSCALAAYLSADLKKQYASN